MPHLFRFLFVHVALGALVGWLFLAILLGFDTGGLWTLISHSSTPLLPLALLAAFFALTFGGAVTASGVLLSAEEGDEPPIGPKRRRRRRLMALPSLSPRPAPRPAVAVAGARRRPRIHDMDELHRG
ncbi:hypothetical protein [Afifella marina]|uniref:Uncharacterized protein n=1 Tax=Afifella marina DSM 2698 TaxID=1120955 RepID=A0A1G5N3S7_AFIMA|nr:hypothetical protein [Afifella marina]MBK1622384.1 hypothetical protein [Afifella marina DSM 2698]MBK1626902.1 hypothetical protein [Afifella marina]MBK5919168.1 hypothetical protein [Afifella marina]RAI21216.1 hypothetical protein CH311_06970 [Afifella marina DSM 2698]SCZ31804.1 hypothetical protein SAMN03080610_01420 [Afifella marina DSM 2698]